jgi:PAS domain S-box-containing protein
MNDSKKIEGHRLPEVNTIFQSLINFAPDAVIVVNNNGLIMHANVRAEKIFRYTGKELIGKPVDIIIPERFRERHDKKMKEYMQNPGIRTMGADLELYALRKDGTEFPVDIALCYIETNDGIIVLSIVRDITEHEKMDNQMVEIVSAVATQLGSVISCKHAEEQARAAAAYARGLIEASIDPLVTISPEGKITDVNKASELVTGVPREKLIGGDFSTYFTEPEKAIEGYSQVFEKGTVRDYPLVIRHTSGKVTDVLYNATVYRNEAGEVEGVFAAARDITEHKRMEEAIRISEAKYRSIFENAAEGIFQTTNNGRFLSANPACVELLGYSSAEELIASVTDVHKLYAEPGRRLHLVRMVKEEGTISDFEAIFNKKDGSKIWVSINAHALRDPLDKVVGLEGMVIDITHRKRAQKNFQMLIDGTPDAIIAIEQNSNILLTNSRTEKLFGYSKLELLGHSYDILIPLRYRVKHIAYCRSYFANPSTKIMALHISSVAKRKDGSEFPVEINMSPMETDEGIIAVIDIRDISEKKR